MGRRTLLLVAALLLAAIGTGVLFVFLKATTSAIQSTAGPAGRSTQVVVPKGDVPEGTAITAALFQTVSVDSALATAGQYVTPAVFDKLVGKSIATRRLEALTPVNRSAFGDTVTSTSSIPLTAGTMSIAVEVDDPARVGTFLYPGARVTLWLLRQSGDQHTARIVLPEVTVVTVGAQGTIPQPTSTAKGATTRGASSLVVLRVKQDEAGAVLLAQQAGDLYFTLLGDKTTPTPTTYVDNTVTTP